MEKVDQYNYPGVIVHFINKTDQDLFCTDYRFIHRKSQKVRIGMKKKLKFVQALPPSIMFGMFYTLLRPILTYGSDVWGLSRTGLDSLNNVLLNHVRCIFCIKVHGGRVPLLMNVPNLPS